MGQENSKSTWHKSMTFEPSFNPDIFYFDVMQICPQYTNTFRAECKKFIRLEEFKHGTFLWFHVDVSPHDGSYPGRTYVMEYFNENTSIPFEADFNHTFHEFFLDNGFDCVRDIFTVFDVFVHIDS